MQPCWRLRDQLATINPRRVSNHPPHHGTDLQPPQRLRVGAVALRRRLRRLLARIRHGRTWLTVLAMAFLIPALAMHASGFLIRCLIAERFAIQNQFVDDRRQPVPPSASRSRRSESSGSTPPARGRRLPRAHHRNPDTHPGRRHRTRGRHPQHQRPPQVPRHHRPHQLRPDRGFVNSVFYLITHYFAPQSRCSRPPVPSS